MFEGTFKPKQVQRESKEGCKIKIRNTSNGKVLEFSGNCSKEQLEMAKMSLGDSKENEE